MAGKKTLFQRVLSKPGAQVVSQPGATPSDTLPAFTVLYVYQRQDVNGSPWLQVGTASEAAATAGCQPLRSATGSRAWYSSSLNARGARQ